MSNPSTLNLKHVVDRTQKRMGWSDDQTAQIFAEYLRYLNIAQANPKVMVVPSVLIDEIWHDHILHTKQYFSDCIAMFGNYMHHLPEKDPLAGGVKPDIQETLALYTKMFNETPPIQVWGCCAGSKECSGSTCQACGRNCSNHK